MEAWKRRTTRLITTLFMLAVLAAPVALLSGCGAMAGAGSAKASLGVPIDVTGHVTPAGGDGEVTGKKTGLPLFSAGFAVYWPNVLAETVAWFSNAVPDFATMLLGGKATAANAPPAVAPPLMADGAAVTS